MKSKESFTNCRDSGQERVNTLSLTIQAVNIQSYLLIIVMKSSATNNDPLNTAKSDSTTALIQNEREPIDLFRGVLRGSSRDPARKISDKQTCDSYMYTV